MLKLALKLIREDNFLSLAGNLVIAVLGFAGFALLVRSLNQDHFAQWVLFVSGGSLVEMLRFGITNNGLVRFLSGAPEFKSIQLIGSNVLISFMATLVIVLIMLGCTFFFGETINASSYALFFTWYPILAFVNLPWNNALVVLQAKMDYGKILKIKAMNSVLFFSFLVFNKVLLHLSVTELVWALLAINMFTSLVCVFMSWDGLKFVMKASRSSNKTLLNFGKYSTFTLIGTNLLRNADLLIISISPMGSAAVALFSIPLKLTELQQIPLRSFAATAFPKMSKASLLGDVKSVQRLFHVYAGALTYLFMLLSMITFVFAKDFVLLISGELYLDPEMTNFNIVALVRILSVYGLLLPIDRMTGIGLDSINKPNINALKVTVMLAANIIGDLIAVFIFESLELVAFSTLLFTCIGISLGVYFLNKEFQISVVGICNEGYKFYKTLLNQFYTLFRKSRVSKK